MHPDVPPPVLAAFQRARRVVAFTGAGMSAESGVPTFRGPGKGLWARFDVQRLATPEAFARDPDTVWAWYEWRRHLVARAAPNAGHLALARLAALPRWDSLRVVTQNVDDLHERAGSGAVEHLHGSLFAARCSGCGRAYESLPAPDPGVDEHAPPRLRLAPPRCPLCGARVRPGVVWFGEMLPVQPWENALSLAAQADLMLVIGTSGRVQPAASLPDTTRMNGGQVVVLNPDAEAAGEGPQDLFWPATAAEGLPALAEALAAAP